MFPSRGPERIGLLEFSPCWDTFEIGSLVAQRGGGSRRGWAV